MRLVNMMPAILIILIVHIIIAIRWMLIKILSAVINDWERIKVVSVKSNSVQKTPALRILSEPE